VGEASEISRAVAVVAALDARRRRATYGRAVAFGVANTRGSCERERQFGALRLLTLATLRLPDVARYGELLHCHAAEQRACCLVAQTLIGASSGAMRLAHRALEMHALELGYRTDARVEQAADGSGDELSGAVADEEGLPVALEQARRAPLALTRATASTANEPTLVPGQIADCARASARDLPDRPGGRLRGMTELLLAGLGRLSPRVRRVVVAVGALLALAAVMAALTLTNPHGGHKRRGPEQSPTAAGSPPPSPPRLLPPVSPPAMRQARQVATRFLAGYLPFAYGRGSALVIRGIAPGLRRELLGQRAQLTPVERRRRPRPVSLQTIGTTPGFVVATAVIDDGGVRTYRLRFTLQREADRWAVSSVAEG
jgi:hypothetical protein